MFQLEFAAQVVDGMSLSFVLRSCFRVCFLLLCVEPISDIQEFAKSSSDVKLVAGLLCVLGSFT
jgi:hypothetical protein